MSTSTTRPIDVYLNKYAQSHEPTTNKLVHWLCIPLIMFSLLGLVWAIPFPALTFLGKGQRYLNWASFFIFFAMGYYLKLSVRLAIATFFLIIIFSTVIVLLERMQRLHGWVPMWQICFLIFIFPGVGQFIGYNRAGRKRLPFNHLKLLLISPVWWWHLLFKKANIPY